MRPSLNSESNGEKLEVIFLVDFVQVIASVLAVYGAAAVAALLVVVLLLLLLLLLLA